MNQQHITGFILAAAACAVAAFSFDKWQSAKAQLNQCQSEFQGFKQGVVYGR